MADRAPIQNQRTRRRIMIGLWVLVCIVGFTWFVLANGVAEPPKERSLSECLGTLERPGCGSKSRGGPMQLAVFVVLISGLTFIGWRIWLSARRVRTPITPASHRLPEQQEIDRDT